MGMSASQVRLLQLTSRKNDIGCELSQLSNQKMALTRDMQKVSKEYNEALNTKVLKWTNNGGVDYVDLSYNGMMKPSNMNKYKPYLLTDTSGLVVVDDEYKKYAEMISPDGGPGDWSGNTRLKILEELTGIPQGTIARYDQYCGQVRDAKEKIDALGTGPVNPAEKTTSVEKFVKEKMKNSDYGYGKTVDVTSASAFESIVNTIKNTFSKYMPENHKTLFEKNCDMVKDYSSYFTTWDVGGGTAYATRKEENKWSINMSEIYKNCFGTSELTWIDIDDTEKYNEWKDDKNNYDSSLASYQSAYDTAVSNRDACLNADQESMLKFYDALFSAIAEKGWTHNNMVNNEDYLNQVLQNNMFTITTMERTEEADENGNYELTNEYNTSIATNFQNIVTVNDSEARNDALVDYEYKKSVINAKETKIDLKMQDLQTEQSAVSQMIQSIEKQLGENVERTMGIFA